MDKPKDIPANEKWCPRCKRVLPLVAFRKSAKGVKGADSYCKACRREDAVNNRPRENARWNAHRKAVAETVGESKDRVKVNARAKAQYHHKERQRCSTRFGKKRCPNQGVRHHAEGYEGESAKKIQWLCPKCHALEHIVERARLAEEPTYL